MSGNPVGLSTSASNETTAYRLFLQDAVPFHTSIHVSIEHGGVDDVNADYWDLAYYYLQPTRATLTDTLDVGNAASEQAHHYQITGQTWTGTQSYQFEGSDSPTTVSDDGRAFTGSSTFTMAINPNNAGVILRRRFDQGIINQKANILVNGTLVGTWYQAGGNSTSRWRENDFQIPASFTHGKRSITITIQFVSSSVDWNEFHYWAYNEQ